MSNFQKLFIVNSVTPANVNRHALHTFTVYWPPAQAVPVYRWVCTCGYHHGGPFGHGPRWATGPQADSAFTAHSGVVLPAWPPMDSAVLASSSNAPLLTGK